MITSIIEKWRSFRHFPTMRDAAATPYMIDLWQRRFNADPHIVGRTILMDNEGYLVLGVMPRNFNFPLHLATPPLLPTDQMQYWIPLGRDLSREPHGAPAPGVAECPFGAYERFKGGVSG